MGGSWGGRDLFLMSPYGHDRMKPRGTRVDISCLEAAGYGLTEHIDFGGLVSLAPNREDEAPLGAKWAHFDYH